VLNKKLQYLSHPENLAAVCGIKRGIERETLRFQPNGALSQLAHPAVFGSALTHPYITTDYSESLMEFITPVSTDANKTITQLNDIHAFVAKNLGDEYLWPVSMPCYIKTQDDIQLANYGTSNIGKMKHLYRQGLKYRYGSAMQVISGIHFNLSFSDTLFDSLAKMQGLDGTSQDFQSEQYLNLIRNFKRYVWLLTYLYGASPALCGSFIGDKAQAYPFEKLAKGTLYLPDATSLRLSDLGYTNNAQASLDIRYSTLPEYVAGLRKAIKTPQVDFQLDDNNPEGHQQLNSNILQIENEFYSPVRPKRTTLGNEKPTDALAERGIEYVEIRSLDINPFSAVGITLEQIHFLDVFLCYCLLKDSPVLDSAENNEVESNLNLVIMQGRDRQLKLQQNAQQILLSDWSLAVFDELKAVAQWLDQAHGTSHYAAVVETQMAAVNDPEQTLSARYLDELRSGNIDSGQWGVEQAKANKAQLSSLSGTIFTDQVMEQHTLESVQKQLQIEQGDDVDFATFLADYFSA
jgi:glutamate--cysteine ligase